MYYDDWKYSKHDNIHADLCISQTNSSVNFSWILIVSFKILIHAARKQW